LQHDDGHSQVLASTVPVVRAYDPAFAYELAAIIRDGIGRMFGDGEDVFYYVNVYNENYPQPAKPEGVDEGIIKGLYRFAAAPEIAEAKGTVRLVGSGSILQQVLAARDLLAERFGIAAEVYSATSFQQLRHEALQVERWNRLHPDRELRVPYVAQVLGADGGPVVAATDWIKTLPDMVAPWVAAPYLVLGTDGFGRSDTREALRNHFEIDAASIAAAALSGLARAGAYDPAAAAAAIRELGIDPDAGDPLVA
jgi:pyruvate dehydrogenase E1 component